MHFVPDVGALIVIEVVNLKTIFKYFNFKFWPRHADGAPISLGHLDWQRRNGAAGRHQIECIRYRFRGEWLRAFGDKSLDHDLNFFPVAYRHDVRIPRPPNVGSAYFIYSACTCGVLQWRVSRVLRVCNGVENTITYVESITIFNPTPAASTSLRHSSRVATARHATQAKAVAPEPQRRRTCARKLRATARHASQAG